jgi:muconate cycloisomerase
MLIAELEIRHLRVPLRRPVRHASHTRSETDNVIVRCVLSDGSVGWGEGVPRDYVTGETVDSAIALIQQSELPSQFTSCIDFEAAVQLAEKLQLAPVPNDDRMCQGNAARCAVELAILDAYGRAFGEPLMNVTKLLNPDLYVPKEKVQYSGVVLSAKGWKAKALSIAYRALGFAQVKVKVGIDGQDDVARLAAVRRWGGRSLNLRVDANEAWPASEAAERIRALEPYGITSVEQPVRHEDIETYASLRKQINTPLMLDESLCSEVDAERAVANGWCDLFNIRLSKCGGFIPSLRLADLAARHGLGYQLGCQVGETAILSAAGRHFATSVKDLRYIEGSFDRRLVLDWLSEEDITFGAGGWAPMLTGCGLGVQIEPERVDAMTVRREVLLGPD